jgi:very-short-patch-repair endonuclease
MTTDLAKRLRQTATKPERLMWQILKPFRDQGWHFRRQVPIGPFIADFACLHANLVIEVDGQSHDFTHPADRDRDEYMQSRGINVVRVSGDEVLANASGVQLHIAELLGIASQTSNTPTPVPSPQGGGEPPRKPRRIRQPRSRLSANSAVTPPLPLAGGDRGGGSS